MSRGSFTSSVHETTCSARRAVVNHEVPSFVASQNVPDFLWRRGFVRDSSGLGAVGVRLRSGHHPFASASHILFPSIAEEI